MSTVNETLIRDVVAEVLGRLGGSTTSTAKPSASAPAPAPSANCGCGTGSAGASSQMKPRKARK